MQFSSPFIAPVVILSSKKQQLWSVIKRNAMIIIDICIQRTFIKFEKLCVINWTLFEIRTLVSRNSLKIWLFLFLNQFVFKTTASRTQTKRFVKVNIYQNQYPSLQILSMSQFFSVILTLTTSLRLLLVIGALEGIASQSKAQTKMILLDIETT